MHTGEIVGFSQDFFEQDIVFDEMEKFSDDNGTDKAPTTRSSSGYVQNDEDEDSHVEEENPELVEHYLVFMFTLWEKSNRTKIQFVAARYDLKSIDTKLLYCEIRNIIRALSFYGFYVTCISGNETAENRSVFKRLCTHTAQDVLLEGTLLENQWIENTYRWLSSIGILIYLIS